MGPLKKIPSKSLLKAGPVLLRLLTVLLGQFLNFSKDKILQHPWEFSLIYDSSQGEIFFFFFCSTGNLQCCSLFPLPFFCFFFSLL